MKKLERPSAPLCLSRYSHAKGKVWNDVTPTDKVLIWEKLHEMQGEFCAYCECSIKRNKHIEHFQPRLSHPSRAFDWDNLFGSCCNIDTCGQYKKSNSTDIVKPDIDNPSDYMFFLMSGEVIAKDNNNFVKAENTINILNLNNNILKQRRAYEINKIKKNVNEFFKMKSYFSEDEWLQLVQEEIDSMKGREFQTALEHAYLYNRNR